MGDSPHFDWGHRPRSGVAELEEGRTFHVGHVEALASDLGVLQLDNGLWELSFHAEYPTDEFDVGKE